MKPSYSLQEIRTFINDLNLTELVILRELVEEEDKLYTVNELTYLYGLFLRRIHDIKKLTAE